MSNPSGTDHDDAAVDDSDPVTEVIDIPGDAGPADPATGARRYTAPGFDAGSTQIIDRVPDPPTEFFTSPAEAFGVPGARTAPRAIPPRRGGRRALWRLAGGLLAAGLLAAAIAGGVAYQRNSERVARENMVRSTIETFNGAVRDGDLAMLRDITCGQTRDNYVDYDEKAWEETYARVAEAKQYPVVASIDEVVVNGDHAEANVTSYMAFDPATRSTRSFDLQFRDDRWKICQAS